jgi:hypothetical protein
VTSSDVPVSVTSYCCHKRTSLLRIVNHINNTHVV